jgi:UDP-N-acetylmuramoyl-tripeptide--D-alanyl-D-alanine ligase
MRRWDPQQLAHASGAQLLNADGGGLARANPVSGPESAIVDSRAAGPGALFVGLAGEHVHGGEFAGVALEAGAWGVLTTPEYASRLVAASNPGPKGVVLAADDPLAALQRLATEWRRALGARVIAVTGSTGKTSTKDLLLGVLSPYRLTVASKGNFNTEIGLPLQILSAPAGTEILVLEMGMRGAGQIAELARIAEPDVGVIVSIGPVHLELLGSIEAIAAAKAELIAALAPGATAIIPAGEPLLEPHLRSDLNTITFGEGGDVQLASYSDGEVVLDYHGETVSFQVAFNEAHMRQNLLAACAAARAVGVRPGGRLELALSPGRGQQLELPGGVTLIDDCYNANPVSMRAALDQLAATAAKRKAGSAGDSGSSHSLRTVAVLGDMLELGPDGPAYHAQIGAYADGIADVLVTVGPLAAGMGSAFDGVHHHVHNAQEAAELVPALLQRGDVVLVKASNGVGLGLVCETLSAAATA